MTDRIAHFQALVQRTPQSELFRFSLAQALLEENRGGEARPHLEYCITLKPDWMLPRILLGKELLAAGQPEQARPHLETALQLAIAQDHEDPAEELRQILAGL